MQVDRDFSLAASKVCKDHQLSLAGSNEEVKAS
jgi:hypothetical protein